MLGYGFAKTALIFMKRREKWHLFLWKLRQKRQLNSSKTAPIRRKIGFKMTKKHVFMLKRHFGIYFLKKRRFPAFTAQIPEKRQLRALFFNFVLNYFNTVLL